MCVCVCVFVELSFCFSQSKDEKEMPEWVPGLDLFVGCLGWFLESLWTHHLGSVGVLF